MKSGKGNACKLCGRAGCHCGSWTVGLILLAVGVLFLLRDLGYGLVPAGVSVWHVLVALIGLKILIYKGGHHC